MLSPNSLRAARCRRGPCALSKRRAAAWFRDPPPPRGVSGLAATASSSGTGTGAGSAAPSRSAISARQSSATGMPMPADAAKKAG